MWGASAVLSLLRAWLPVLAAAMLAACATRAVDVPPEPANPADFAGWDCDRIDDEVDAVQLHAADLAYAVDEHIGNNIVALGIGVAVFWPALLAMRPEGLEAKDLAQLKGRYEALKAASRNQGCPPPAIDLAPARAAGLPVAVGDRLVYETRVGAKGPAQESSWRLLALRRDLIEWRFEATPTLGPWLQDLAGNLAAAPPGEMYWPRLLRRDLVLGQVLAGEILIAGDDLAHARVRGQVVAVGPQSVAGRNFDAAVIELFGDALRGDLSTRLDGVIVVDRASGVLLRLDLRSARPDFALQRRLVRVEATP
jgi:hypothetical protein